MSNDDADKIRQLEEQLEAAKAQARMQALEQELAALKGQDATLGAQADAARAAQEAAERAAAEAAAIKAAEAKATADRAASLEAELAAIRAQGTAAASPPPAPVVAPPVAVAPVFTAPPADAPPVVAAPTAKKGGLVATLIILLVLLAATLVALFLALRGELKMPGSELPAPMTDVVLIDAGSFGPAPAKADARPLVTFDALSSPVGSAAPAETTTVSLSEVAGDTAEIYGLSYARCQSLDPNSAEEVDGVTTFVAALNTDDTLGIGRALTTADYDAYFQQITFGHLLADTRVTYNGYSAGANFPMQAVLQKGALVGYDRFGVPRLHCGSGVALTAPVLAAGETRFTGAAWGDLDAGKLVTLTPATSPQTGFTVLPVGPSNVLTAISTGPRQCTWSAPGACPAPTSLTEVKYPNLDGAIPEGPAPVPTTCSVYPPGTTDADAVASRLVNNTAKSIHGYLVLSAEAGCGTRWDVYIGPGEALNVTTYWPGSIMLFTDGTSSAVIGEYTFGEMTLFVVQ